MKVPLTEPSYGSLDCRVHYYAEPRLSQSRGWFTVGRRGATAGLALCPLPGSGSWLRTFEGCCPAAGLVTEADPVRGQRYGGPRDTRGVPAQGCGRLAVRPVIVGTAKPLWWVTGGVRTDSETLAGAAIDSGG